MEMNQQEQFVSNGSTTNSIIYHNPSRDQIHSVQHPCSNQKFTVTCTVAGQDSVILGCGDQSCELWVEGRHLRDELQVLGVTPDCSRVQQWARCTMDNKDIEEHCPWFSTLQIPYVLDHLVLNQKLSNIRIKKIAAGSIHCLFLTEDGFVYGIGHNGKGQLLNYDKNHTLSRDSVSLPTLLLWFVERNIRIKDIACAGWFSAFITTDDKLYTVGRFGSKYMLEPVLRETKGAISVLGVGSEHLVFQCSSNNGNQVYSMGLNDSGQLGIRSSAYEDHAVEAQIATEPTEVQQPFNFCRLNKIDGGQRFTIVLTSQFEVYAAGAANSNALNGFSKLDLSEHIGAARIKDFSCSFYTTSFLDSVKRVLTFSEPTTNRSPHIYDASAIANPVVTATSGTFHVIDTHSGRLFSLDFGGKAPRLVEQRADLNSCQMFDHPDYHVTSYVSGYSINMMLLKSKPKSSLNFFVEKLKNSLSQPTLSDIFFVFK